MVDVPGCGKGYVGPGGKSGAGRHKNCTGGANGYIDEVILGKSHLYGWPTCKTMYNTGAFDPEGILGCLTSIFLCFLGLQAGRTLVYYKNPVAIVGRWLTWGVITGGLGLLLCKAQKNDGWIPLNKNLWSLSFVLLMAGMAFILLSLFYILIDRKKYWNGSPFIYVGMNSIVIYMGHEILGSFFPFSYDPIANSHAGLLFTNLIGASCWAIIAYYLFLKKIFISI